MANTDNITVEVPEVKIDLSTLETSELGTNTRQYTKKQIYHDLLQCGLSDLYPEWGIFEVKGIAGSEKPRRFLVGFSLWGDSMVSRLISFNASRNEALTIKGEKILLGKSPQWSEILSEEWENFISHIGNPTWIEVRKDLSFYDPVAAEVRDFYYPDLKRSQKVEYPAPSVYHRLNHISHHRLSSFITDENGDDEVLPWGGATLLFRPKPAELKDDTGRVMVGVFFYYGIAVCGEMDLYNRKLGVKIATERLDEFLARPPIKFEDEISCFDDTGNFTGAGAIFIENFPLELLRKFPETSVGAHTLWEVKGPAFPRLAAVQLEILASIVRRYDALCTANAYIDPDSDLILTLIECRESLIQNLEEALEQGAFEGDLLLVPELGSDPAKENPFKDVKLEIFS